MGGEPAKQGRTSAVRQAVPLVLARLTAAVITVVIPLCLAHAFTLEGFGTYKQAFLVCGPLLAVLPLGVPQSLYYFVPRARTLRGLLLQTQAFSLAMGVAGAGLLWLALPLVAARLGNPELLGYRWELALFVLFSLAGGPLETMLTSQGRTGASALAYVGYEVLKSAALVLPVLLGFGLRGSIAAMAAVTCVRFLVAAALVLSVEGEGPSWRGVREQLAYALPFGAAMALNVPQQVAHQYAVAFAMPPALFAVYAAGCFQVPLVNLLYAPTSEVLMVRVGQLDREGAGAQACALLREAVRKLSLAFVPASAFLVVCAPWVVGALFGPKFQAAVPVFRVSVLGIALACVPMDGLLRARGHTRAIFHASALKALVTVPLLAALVPTFGMMGGITAWLLAEVAGRALLLRRLPQALTVAGAAPPPLRAWLPVEHLVRLAGATLVCAAVTLMLVRQLEPTLAALGGRAGAVAHLAVAGSLFVAFLGATLQGLGLRPVTLITSLRR